MRYYLEFISGYIIKMHWIITTNNGWHVVIFLSLKLLVLCQLKHVRWAWKGRVTAIRKVHLGILHHTPPSKGKQYSNFWDTKVMHLHICSLLRIKQRHIPEFCARTWSLAWRVIMPQQSMYHINIHPGIHFRNNQTVIPPPVWQSIDQQRVASSL